MPKRSWNLNTVYISERLQECLRPISRCALTTVVAPMGYGKTTAVNWYLLERAKLDEAAVVRISVYSDNLAIFWKSVQEAFSHAGFDFLRAYPCPDDAAPWADLFMGPGRHLVSYPLGGGLRNIVAVIERPASGPALVWPDGWTVLRERRYGDTRLEMAQYRLEP